MQYRSLILLLALLVSPHVLSAQAPQQQLFEEIQAAPDGAVGEWTIGGQKFVATDQTRVFDQVPIEPGTLAVVLFVQQEGKNIALQIQPLAVKASQFDDGPYVFWKDDTTAEIVTMREGKVERKIYGKISQPLQLDDLAGAESTITLDPTRPTPPPSKWEAPSRLLAISDLEGRYVNARHFLQENGVIDDEAHWQWGDGHLVLIGDLIDRGPMVTELMWMIRRLEREASAAGGQVHYVLGNHEAMVMAGDLRYIHPKYIFTSQRIGISYDQLFGPTSDIGRWWRSKNGAMTIGDLLFVHGGYSPMLDQAGLDLDTLNDRIRDGLAPAIPVGDSPGANPVGHQHGPFWYRGYFDAHAAQWGKASRADVQQILDRHQAKHIVIGHTLVEHVGPLDETGQVIAIDVHWSHPGKGEGLLMEDGKLWRLSMTGEREELKLDNK